ncbi:MAG: peptidoglycan DD-metalloendopeptidase family protein [Sedimenticola sp.]|nr:peptidoglycan DD-metalloendopeptidase family protein [Sedimenticola sp.]
MRPVNRSAGAVAALLGLLLVASAVLAQEEQIRSRESELKALQGEISSLQQTLDSRRQRRQQLQAQLRQTEERIGRSARQLRELGNRLASQQKRLAQLGQERSTRQQALENSRQVLVRQIRAAYVMGRQERVKILLNQQDPATVSRMMIYYDYFNRERARQMAAIGEILGHLNETESALREEERALQQTREQVAGEKAALDREQAGRQQVIALLNREIDEKGQALERFRRDEQQLQALVERLQSEFAALPLETERHQPFKRLRGKLDWPARGRLVSLFGQQRAGNLTWDGVVIAAGEGSEVRAIHHGRVAFADWLRGFGLLLIIDHGDGYMSLYGHNQSLFKDTGEWVEPGEAVALMGSSGGKERAGVYFGIRHNGRAVNPKKWCKRTRDNRIGSRLQRQMTPASVPFTPDIISPVPQHG